MIKVVAKKLMRRMHRQVYSSRLNSLTATILPHFRNGDRVLDVGCGTGALGRTLMDSPDCPVGVEVLGLESVKRGGEAIPVTPYDGRTIPFRDETFDVVLLADVLHHEPEPHRLLEECVRVTRRLLLIKDHKLDGFLAWHRIALLDWAANAPYGVPCLYRYNSPAQWAESHRRHGLKVVRELTSMRLYLPVYNAVFGGRLQYMAVLKKERTVA